MAKIKVLSKEITFYSQRDAGDGMWGQMWGQVLQSHIVVMQDPTP
jgi:hypothetical protein